MKKYLLTLITLSLLLCEASFSGGGMAFATPASLGNGVTWEISGTTLTIGYEGEGSGVMPDYANVTDRPWDDAKGDITSIIIENGVTSIGKYAFKDFTAITALNDLPSSVTILGYQSFNGCTSLTSVTIPQNVTKTGDGLFGGCSSLTTVVWNAENCTTSLKSDGSDIALSTSWNPFYGTPPRSTITSFTFGSNVEVIPAGLCSSMTNITSITIPSSVVTIGNDAFKGCSKITTITIPSSVNSIGTSAFQSCSVLANITIPQGVTTIGNNTFDGCATLKAITIPSSVTSIGNYAFRNCSTMVRVNFPSALTSIGTSAFENTPKLKSIPLASATSLTSIGASAFALSSADATAAGLLVIPSGVTSIEGNAFKNRSGITGVVICNTNTSTWTICSANTCFTGMQTDIPIYVYSQTCLDHYADANTTGWKYFNSAGYTTSYTISNMDCGTTASTLKASLNLRTGSLTFSGSKCDMKNYDNSSNKAPWAAYKEAIKSVTFNSYVQTIGEYAFYECGALASVNTASATNLTSIGQRAFQYCRALTSITIPASVTSMSAYSFYDTGLTSVTWNAKNCPSITSASTSATPFANINFVDYNKHPEKLTSFTFGSEVEVIPAYLCYGLTGITSITIPSKVTTIGGSAFATCSALTSVTLPTSITTINSGAFGTCNALTSVKYVGTADQWCGITFGNSTSNPTYFSHSLKLNNSDDVATSVSISASTIGKYAFERNTELTSVTLSSAVDNFQTSAFDDCTGLTSLRFDGTLAQWCDNTFANNEANPLYYAHHFYLNSGTELTNLEIPEAISSISDFAFYNGSGFESISVYSTTTWGANTFYGCVTPTILGDVTGTCGEHLTWRLNGNTLYIEGYGDMYDYANNTSMPWYSYRAQIQNVEFVDEATSVGNYAFNSLTNIQSVSFGSGIETIGSYSFTGCTGLTGTLTIGEGTTTINQNAFQGCTNITRVELNSGLTFLGYYAFYGCSNLEAITVPSSLETCNGYVFMSCNKLEAVYYEGSVDDWCGINFVSGSSSSPANNAIAKLYVDGNTETYLTEARITASAIGNYAFYNNKELTSVIITSAGSVGTDAFHSCSNLARLEVDPVTPPTTANNNVFWGVTKTIPFYIPAAGASAYADAARWSDFADNRFLFGSCGENLSFVFAEATGTLTISGTGAMQTFASAGAVPWYSFRSDIKAVVIGSGVTTIGNYAFYGCNNEFFTSITIPEGITSLGNSAFQGCTHMTSVALPSTLQTIGSNAFHSNAFTSIIIPEGVTTIASAFPNCASLTSITIPSTVRSLANNTFNGCALLETITWNADTCADYTKSSNDGKTFTYNSPWGDAKSHIYTFNFGSNVRSIPSNLCQGMTQLTSVTLPVSLKTIRQDAFFGCTELTAITIPANVKTIQGTVFENCSKLASVTSQAMTPPTLGSDVFKGTSASRKLYLPHDIDVKAAYRAASGWSSFTEANTFPKIVQFSLNEKSGDAIDPQFFDNLTSKASAPSEPAAEYYTFSGWYENETGTGSAFAFSTTNITADKTLYAKWTEDTHTVTVAYKCGEATIQDAGSVSGVGVATAQDATAPSITGYTFSSWSAMPSGVTTESALTSATISINATADAQTITANYSINQYTVSFDSNGGSEVSSITQNYGTEVSAPANPSREGYTFNGWLPAVPSTMPAENTECVAQWNINQYTISFNSNGGSEVSSITQDYNSEVSAPTDPTREGYTFNGWIPAVPSTMPASNTECVAQWTINSYDVTFDLQGHGSAIDAQSVNYNGLVSEPSDPEADYYTFGGWYKEAGCSNAWNFSEDQVTDDLTLYAKWTLNGLALNENVDNSSLLAAYDGQTTNVTMTRSLTNAQYNTFCLPFSLSADQMEDAFGAGYDLEELTDVTYEGETLALEFTQREALVAGKPYLLQPANNAVNPSFENVTISAAAPSDGLNNAYIEYRGVYSPALLEGGNHNLLFLGAGNELFWPASNGNLKGFRAYFVVKSPALGAMRARIVKKEDTATGIDHIQPSAVSSQKYIKDGILYIERDGKTFNAQGQRIK